MARKPQLILNKFTVSALLLGMAVPWTWPLSADELKVSSSPNPKVIINPFVNSPYGLAHPPTAVTRQGASANSTSNGTRSLDHPGTLMSLGDGSRAQAVKNPFAVDSNVPARHRPLRWGPVSRWREPNIGLPVELNASHIETTPDLPERVSVPPVAKEFVQPSTAEGRLQKLPQPVTLEPIPAEVGTERLAGMPSDDHDRNTSASMDSQSSGREPPHAANGDGFAISQPAWIVPEGVVQASNTVPTDDSTSGFALQGSSPAASTVIIASESEQRYGAEDQPYDPFEEPDSAPAVVSDQTTDDAASQPLVTLNRAQELFGEVAQLAKSATTIEQLSEVIHQCRGWTEQYATLSDEAKVRALQAWAHNRRGELLDEAGHRENALRDFQIAVELNPQYWPALHNRAILFARRREHEAALRDFATALHLNPRLTVAYRNRGELLSALGRTEAAIADYSAALALQPTDAELFALRAYARHRLRDYTRAMNDYNQSLRLQENNPLAFTGRGNLFAEIGQFDRALDDYRQAVELDDSFGDAHRGLAWLLATCPDRRYRDPAASLAAARMAAKFGRPEDPFILEALAAAHASNQQFDEAIRIQQRALTAVPPSAARPLKHRLALYMRQQPFFSGSLPRVQRATHESSMPR